MTCAPCSRVVVAFDVDTRPQPKRRARHGQGRTYSDPRTVAYEAAVGLACRAVMVGAPELGDVALWCLFEQRDARRCDGDNAYKAIADAINGIAYKDDRQVIDGYFHTVHRAPVDRVSVAVLRV